jgi:D-alanine-D-alanine ligase
MRVGLTYDLKKDHEGSGLSEEALAELDTEVTIVGIEGGIRAAGHEPVRIGSAQRLVERLAAGDRFDLVFNIAEGLYGAARESQVPAILDAYRIPYSFSDPLVLAVALHKGLAKHVARAAGVPTPDFCVIESAADLDRVELPFPLFAKPIAEGTSKGVTPASLVRDHAQLRTTTLDLLQRFGQPVLVERFLSGREFTVGIVGTGEQAEVLGSMEVLLLEGAEQDLYSYQNKHDWIGKVTYRIGQPREDEEVRKAEMVALAAWRALGCRDAGRVDVRSDDRAEPCFIEVNPLAGLNPEISDLSIMLREIGIPYDSLIRRILESAIARSRTSA